MRDFFKGWRRKAGCVTLAMACVFAAAWVRGIAIGDRDVFDSTEWTGTTDGVLFASGPTFELVTGPSGGFGRRTNNDHSIRVTIVGENEWVRIVNIPHWIVVIPLTILSAYLLLVKPRTTATITSEAKPAEAP